MKQGRLTGVELVGEAEWLLDGGMSPFLISEALDRSLDAIAIACRRAGRKDLASHFYAVKDVA